MTQDSAPGLSTQDFYMNASRGEGTLDIARSSARLRGEGAYHPTATPPRRGSDAPRRVPSASIMMPCASPSPPPPYVGGAPALGAKTCPIFSNASCVSRENSKVSYAILSANH